MKNIIIIILLTILMPAFVNADLTKSTCQKLGGVIVDRLECPNSSTVRENENFCVLSERPLVYFNGCTKSIGNFGTTFFKPCLEHDFCYHHEPATNGLSKKQCDKNFYDNMLNVCSSIKKLPKFYSCKSTAWAFYQAVRIGGKKSWECSNSVFDYSDLKNVLDLSDSL